MDFFPTAATRISMYTHSDSHATVLASSKDLRPASQRSGCSVGSSSTDEDRISISPTELLYSKLSISDHQTVRQNGSSVKAPREDFSPQSQSEFIPRESKLHNEAEEEENVYSLTKLKLRKGNSIFANFPDPDTVYNVSVINIDHDSDAQGFSKLLTNSETESTCRYTEFNDSRNSNMSVNSKCSLLSESMKNSHDSDIPSRTTSICTIDTIHSITDDMVKLPKLKKSLARSSSDCANFQVDTASSPSSSFNAASTRMASRARSLTDMDFQELQGCIDLGFRFDRSNIGELCNTLPALHVCCAVDKELHDSSPLCQSPMSPAVLSPAKMMYSASSSSASTPSTLTSASHTPTWRISSPGDDPNDVKGRLRHWAQAVACNVRLFY